jgi:hypothetical protein
MMTVAFYTGQAVVGNMKEFSFYTGQFSTCSPVVMYNEKTNEGGAFHLPGKSGSRAELLGDWETYIQPMLNLVQPTVVWVFLSGLGSKADREVLAKLFNEHKTTHGKTFTIHKDDTERMGIYISAPNGKLEFSVARSFAHPVHDMKKQKKAPDGCTVLNLGINYDTWLTLT